MKGKIIAAVAAGLAAGVAIGFLVANSLNKSELEAARTELASLRSTGGTANPQQSSVELSDEEIRAKIADADKNAGNFEYQKTLGLALYTYAAMKQEARLLEDVAKLLERAYQLNSDDYDVIVSLANVSFDLGQLKKEDVLNARARELYIKALSKNEKDVRVQTDLGLTFLLAASPDNAKAVAELKKALEIDPKYEKGVQYITQALAASGDKEQARKYLEQLREINPDNSSLNDLELRVSSKE